MISETENSSYSLVRECLWIARHEKGIANKHPNELAKLLTHLIPKMTKSWMCTELLPFARTLRNVGLEARLLTKIQNNYSYARLL